MELRVPLALRPASLRCKSRLDSDLSVYWASTNRLSFKGDHAKCDQLNELLCKKAGFEECYDVSSVHDELIWWNGRADIRTRSRPRHSEHSCRWKPCRTIADCLTSTRKVDCLVANAVTGLGTTVTKIASDLRHLAFLKEIGEPREKTQIGSSAMVSRS